MKLIILCTIFFNSAYAGLKEDINQVMKLRQEVEVLSVEVEYLKKSSQSEIDVYLSREQEVNATLLKEKFKTDQLNIQIKSGKEKIERLSGAKYKNVKNFLTDFWEKYEKSLSKANPVISTKLKERLSKLKFDYSNRKISYEYGLLQTWYILEDDLKLSKEADFVIASIPYGEKTIQAEMVRMGRTMAFIRTAEGRYGVLYSNPEMKIDFYEETNSKEMIDVLIKQFKQQTKTGLYQLPGLKI